MYSVSEVDYQEWTRHLRQCRQVNLMQSWQYGEAKEIADKWRAVRFLVRDENDRPIALAQVLVKELPVLGGAARMNRGPLLVGDVEAGVRDRVVVNVIRSLLREWRRRRWWVVQIAPELHDAATATRLSREVKLRRLPNPPWASGLVSLAADEEQLLMALQGKWRNCLRKGWRLGVSVAVFDGNCPELNELLARYGTLQENRGFAGLPDALILALARQTGTDWQFTLFVASEAGSGGADQSIGMLVSVRHGDVSTYLIGSTTEMGRKLQANYVLLWRAMQHARSLGCRWFDIGGLNSTTPKGIAHFKQGLNPVPYTLVGEWRGLLIPFRRVARGPST